MSNRELKEILLRGYESKDLDYKAPAKWDEGNKKACCELVKDVLGMANTKGGFIVLGVREREEGFSWDGLTREQVESWDTSRLNRFVQNYSDPPINSTLRKVAHEGKTFVIIEVPHFPDTPHICQKDFPDVLSAPTLYVRTDNNETAPIRSSADFRAVVEQATRNRREAMLTAVRSILVGGVRSESAPEPSAREQFLMQRSEAVARFEAINPFKDKGYTGYREACFFPGRFKRDLFTIEQLRAAAESAHVTLTGWPFLFINRNRKDVTYAIADGLETLIPTRDFRGNDRCDFWRFQQSGFFYQRTLMWEESARDRQGAKLHVADFDAVTAYTAEAIHCLARIYNGLVEDDEDLTFVLCICGTQGRELTTFDTLKAWWGEYSCRMPEIEVQQNHSMADWRAGTVDHAVEITKDVFLRFNWESPNVQAIRETIEKLFARKL